MNLSDSGDGMVSIHDKPNTAFMSPEKNMRQDKEEAMDSTPISDIMDDSEDPRMMMSPRMMSAAQQPMMMMAPPPKLQGMPSAAPTGGKNPLNLTDEQMTAILVAVCTAIAISKPVQEKLAGVVPQFINEQGSRSVMGLAATGVVAAVIFYVARHYVIKP